MQNIEKLFICYNFNFVMVVKNRKGKIVKNYGAPALGANYNYALWDVFFLLKKRGKILISVTSVTVKRIAFALNHSGGFVHNLKLEDYKLQLPEDLNSGIDRLPQKK